MYLCGPTVYDLAHLGHGRSAVSFDIIRRYLEYKYGEENVTFVTNYTDIDDKMINRAAEEKITVKELADRIIPEYERDYDALSVKPSTIQTKATEYVNPMIEIVKTLEQKGYAYELDGDVYFEIEKFEKYGKLSKQNLEELREGARVDVNDNKKHPHDFVLWKSEKPGEPSWDSPWGKGRPGWHIECSAMSQSNLGQPFDIHGGGADLTFPHHEDEIAQSEAAFGAQFCNYWLHNGFITVNKEKMSKSLGNFSTLRDIFEKYDPQAVRYFFLTAQYRSPIEFSEDQLEQSENTLEGVKGFLVRLNNYIEKITDEGSFVDVSSIKKFEEKFELAMDNDFDTPQALAAFFGLIKEVNKHMDLKDMSKSDANRVLDSLNKVNTVLRILPNVEVDVEVSALVEERNLARTNKDFARADEIRDELLKNGIEIEDTNLGTIWKKV